MSGKSGWILAVGVLLSSAVQVDAQEPIGHVAGQSVFRGSLGVFTPDGESAYWEEKQLDFTATTDDYEDFAFALDYLYFVSPRVGVLFSLSAWEGKATQSYRDFVDNFGDEISHVTSVDAVWLDFGLIFHLLGRRAPLMPYVGAGGSLVGWELAEEGDFIDFDTRANEIFTDLFVADGEAFGFFVLAGLEIPLGSSAALFAEARWRDADDELEQDFAGFGNLDLSGRSLTAGLSFSF